MLHAARRRAARAWPWPPAPWARAKAIVFLKALVRPARRRPSRRALRPSGRGGLRRRASAAATTATSPARRRRCWRRSRAGGPGRGPSRRCPPAVGFQGRPDARPERRDAGARAGGGRRSRRPTARGETTLVSLWGHVRRPGVYEVPLRHAAARGSIDEHGRRRAGRHRHDLPRRALGARRSRADAGATRRSIPTRCARRARRWAPPRSSWSARPPARSRSARRWPAFFERESCGQCPPCTVGSASLARVAARGGSGRGARRATCTTWPRRPAS